MLTTVTIRSETQEVVLFLDTSLLHFFCPKPIVACLGVVVFSIPALLLRSYAA